MNEKCVVGITANLSQIDYYLNDSLMLVTALAPHIGYDQAAAVAKKAHSEGKTLKQVTIEMDLLTQEEFDAAVIPSQMTHPNL